MKYRRAGSFLLSRCQFSRGLKEVFHPVEYLNIIKVRHLQRIYDPLNLLQFLLVLNKLPEPLPSFPKEDRKLHLCQISEP